jgi:hypothetical protein
MADKDTEMADEEAKVQERDDTRMLRDLRHIRHASELSVRLQCVIVGVLCLMVAMRLVGWI